MSSKTRRLRAVSLLETVSFLGLLVAMLLDSDTGVSVLGATHGILFLAYASLVWIDHDDFGWTTWFALAAIVTGPLGAIIVLERLRRDGAEREAAASR